MKTRFLYDDQLDSSLVTVSASSEAYGHEAENVLDSRLGYVWKTGNTSSSEWIKFDLGLGNNDWNAVALFGGSMLTDLQFLNVTELRLQANTTDSWTSPPLDEEIDATEFARGIYFLGSLLSYRWVRLAITKFAAGEQTSLGKVMIGPYLEPARMPPDGGVKWGRTDTSETSRGFKGQRFTNTGVVLRTLSLDYRAVTDSQVEELETMADAVGTNSPVVVTVDQTNVPTRGVLYGHFTRIPDITHVHGSFDRPPLWDVRMELEEAK